MLLSAWEAQPWPSRHVRGIDATIVPFRVGDFEFANTPVNGPLVPNLATATFVAKQCYGAFGGGTGTEKALIAMEHETCSLSATGRAWPSRGSASPGCWDTWSKTHRALPVVRPSLTFRTLRHCGTWMPTKNISDFSWSRANQALGTLPPSSWLAGSGSAKLVTGTRHLFFDAEPWPPVRKTELAHISFPNRRDPVSDLLQSLSSRHRRNWNSDLSAPFCPPSMLSKASLAAVTSGSFTSVHL